MASNITLTPSEILPILDHYMSRCKPDGTFKNMLAPFIWGPPGIGKTEIARLLATLRDSRLVAMHLPQYDPTDLKGIPVRDDKGRVVWITTSYLPQASYHNVDEFDNGATVTLEWPDAIGLAVYVYDDAGNEIGRHNDASLPDVGDAAYAVIDDTTDTWQVGIINLPSNAARVRIDDKAIIFLDELSAADPSTQNAALQLILDRRVGEYDVPPSVPLLAAGNREEDGAFVQTLSHPLCNRFAHLVLTHSTEDWIEWAIGNSVHPAIIGFIKSNESALFNYNEVKMDLAGGRYGFGTPRTWKFLSDQYLEWDEFVAMVPSGAANPKTLAKKLRSAAYGGIIGEPLMLLFKEHLDFVSTLPQPDDIAAGTAPDLDGVMPIKSFSLLYGLIYKLEGLYLRHYDDDLSGDDQPAAWRNGRDNILDYIVRNFGGDMGSWAWTVICRKTAIKETGLPALRSDACLRFSKKFLPVTVRMGVAR